MNAIMELNYRMVNNINEKVKLAYQNKMKKKSAWFCESYFVKIKFIY